MSANYGIAVADDDSDHRALLSLMLKRAGHTVTVKAQSGEELLTACELLLPDLAVVDVKMPGLDGIETALRLWERFTIPSIIVSAFVSDNVVTRANSIHAAGLLMKPIREPELASAIEIAVRSSAELKTLHQVAATARQALEDRKLIERAKGIVMRQRAIGEEAAFKFLQDLARRNRQKLIEVAKQLLFADQVLNLGSSNQQNGVEPDSVC